MKTVSIVLFAGTLGCALVQPVQAAEASRFNERAVWSFGGGTDGQYPTAGLIDENGTLYGTTTHGGAQDEGVLFSIDAGTGAETVLYSFCTKRPRYCLDGAAHYASLIDVKGRLVGTTGGGGATGRGGAVFSFNLFTRKEKLLHSFCQQGLHCMDGGSPEASLVDAEGLLYGTTLFGGNAESGVVFSIDLETGTEKQLHSFCSEPHCIDGKNSASGLVAVNGTLYGTTVAGGANYTACDNRGCGTVYALDPTTGNETVVYSFLGGSADGDGPEGNLIFVNGLLFGVTQSGGVGGCLGGDGCGTVFSVDPSTGTEKMLYFFCQEESCADGAEPLAGLLATRGKLYGTTLSGGANGHGTVFSIDPATGAETVLYSFCGKRNCVDGSGPKSSLIDVNGVLYGTTERGGAYDKGTVFALTGALSRSKPSQ